MESRGEDSFGLKDKGDVTSMNWNNMVLLSVFQALE
jgi:hypothetical protein